MMSAVLSPEGHLLSTALEHQELKGLQAPRREPPLAPWADQGVPQVFTGEGLRRIGF